MLTAPLPSSYELPLRSHTDLCRVYSLLMLLYDHRDLPPVDRHLYWNRLGLNWEQYLDLIYDAGELLWHVLSDLAEGSSATQEAMIPPRH